MLGLLLGSRRQRRPSFHSTASFVGAMAAGKIYADPRPKELRFTATARWLRDELPPDTLPITHHDSWNRSKKLDYPVTLVRVENNRVQHYESLATGWLQGEMARRRPADVLVMTDGSLLLFYRISYRPEGRLAPVPIASAPVRMVVTPIGAGIDHHGCGAVIGIGRRIGHGR
jgi:hypothetical protein